MAYYERGYGEPRRKSLLIGINYLGSKNQLSGCIDDVESMHQFITSRGYPSDRGSQVIMTDYKEGAFAPTGHNILAAIDWLVSEPGSVNFLHYSGHGGTVAAPQRESGFNDTICPVDFQTAGQIDSSVLHHHLVSALPPSSTLFVIFDCCHSGSAIELPYVYRTDENGQINLVDNLRAGMELVGEASSILHDGLRFDMQTMSEAKQLYAGASSFFKSLQHMGEQQQEGLGQADSSFAQHWGSETKMVTLFSGCRDEETSADANIGGRGQGAMTSAFLDTLRQYPDANYITVLQVTREHLKQSHYQQVPQLSVGVQNFQLDQPMRF